jgi:hypothetical protein
LEINSELKIWEVVDKFEDWAYQKKDWKVIKGYDLIKEKNEYYKFIWTSNFHTDTFKKILSIQSCSLGNHRSYKSVKPSFLVWILNETPKPVVWGLIKEAPCLSKRVAIYAINTSFGEIPHCLKLNETHTNVLDDFENFLKTELGIRVKVYFKNKLESSDIGNNQVGDFCDFNVTEKNYH